MENENRLIDAKKLPYSIAVDDNGKQIFYVKAEDIDKAPTVDAVEVVHGWWDACEDYHYICATEFTCSNCKETFCNSEMDDKEYLAMMKYCPNCGARMDGDGNG